MAIINSLLDTDLYKFTMGQVAFNAFPDTTVEYKFKCRNKDVIWTEKMAKEISDEVNCFCNLRFTGEELSYLDSLEVFTKKYLNYLKLFSNRRKDINIYLKNNELLISINGLWSDTIFFEVPVLAIINEVYFRNTIEKPDYEEAYTRLIKKVKIASNECFTFSEFGTRRRFSYEWHKTVIDVLATTKPSTHFIGTSNVYFSKYHGLIPIGTMAHEFICVGQAIKNIPLLLSQKFMFNTWLEEYDGKFGIVLSDTLGTEKFLKDFVFYYANNFSGVRHDSGDPFIWGEKIIYHYNKLGIDPKTKTLVFSDNLTFEKCREINYRFRDITNVSFGIGTNLTNDFPNITPLNIVIKVVSANNTPVAKISDDEGKTMCDNKNYVELLKNICRE
jgi:nicotinate phosphoribosyltransferase